ncbi:MAG: hypothetical protein V3T70_11285, partial [Phycisphaerae bacterium]
DIFESDLVSAGVTLTSTMKVRFTANDDDPQSIVEGGLDAFSISSVICAAPCPAHNGDLNQDALTDGEDVTAFLGFVLGAGVPTADQICSGDFNDSGVLEAGDVPGLVTALLGP